MAESQDRTFGIEEEFLLLDPVSGAPQPLAPTLRELSKKRSLNGPTHTVIEGEFLASQVEISTSVCQHGQEALTQLLEARSSLAELGRETGVLVAPTGGAPVLNPNGSARLTDDPRYAAIGSLLGDAVRDHYVNGLHVHVGVPDESLRVQVLNRVRPFLPALLALSGNSPLWAGQRTGFQSWRILETTQMPVAQCPPFLPDPEAYHARVAALVSAGVFLDDRQVTWMARLSKNFPTIEFRVCDSQLTARESVALALTARAMVNRAVAEHGAGAPAPTIDGDTLDASLWVAAREGSRGSLLDPLTLSSLPGRLFLSQLLQDLLPYLGEDATPVTEFFRSRTGEDRSSGTGADHQLTAWDTEGLAGVLSLFENRLERA